MTLDTIPIRTFEVHYQLEADGPDADTRVARSTGSSSIRACRKLAERVGSMTVKMVYEVR